MMFSRESDRGYGLDSAKSISAAATVRSARCAAYRITRDHFDLVRLSTF
jgi:hypothetical protein